MNKNPQFYKGVIVGLIASIFMYMAVMWYNVTINPEYRNSVNVNRKVNEIINVLDEYYVDGVDVEELREGVFAGVADSVGDRYTSYLSNKNYATFIETMSGTYAGIGVYVYAAKEDRMITVSATINGSPGEGAGLRKDDKIVKVNGTPVSGEQLDDAVEMMKGKPGTDVIITVLRKASNETFDLTVKREKIDVPTVEYKMLDNNLGYVGISSFDDNTANQFKLALTALNDQGQEALIIDVRNNLGGYLNRVVEICDMVLPECTIVYREDKAGRRKYSKSAGNQLFKGPMAVLINSESASASEILAGALKDNNAAVLVGETTFGKGLVQQVFKLADDSAVKVTIEKYFTPSGVSINGTGIAPDYEVLLDINANDIMGATIDEAVMDTQLEKAVEVLQMELTSS